MNLALILHLAPEPTLDIARVEEIAGETAYILTGGFRAKPWAYWPLAEVLKHPDIVMTELTDSEPPAGHPTLFEANQPPPADATNLLKELGLI